MEVESRNKSADALSESGIGGEELVLLANSKLSIESLLNEYGILVAKMGSNESWAASFVALYFAFMASVGAAAAFMIVKLMENQETIFSSLFSLEFERVNVFQETLLRFAILLASAIGAFLNVWAISMVIDYKASTQIILDRLSGIEASIEAQTSEVMGFARAELGRSHRKNGHAVTISVVGPVLFLFFSPWALAIYSALFF